MNRKKFLQLSTAAIMSIFMMRCSGSPNKWKVGNRNIRSSILRLHTGQSAIYNGNINGGNFKNFEFKAKISHSEEAKASFWIHSDEALTKGYSILLGRPVDDRRRSGSLASIRNLYRPSPSSFDLKVKVAGKRIVVMIDGMRVVDYLEPAEPYRTTTNIGQLLSSGLIGFRVENGTLNVANIEITPLTDNLPNYPEGREPLNERNDAVTHLQQQNFPVIDYHVHTGREESLEDALEKSFADGFEFGIAVNCGIGFRFQSDEEVRAYIEENRHFPVFHGMQAEGREWMETFSQEVREMFDYVFTDALTFHDHKGRRTLLWLDSTVFIDIPEQEYMDMIMDRTLKIINEEPIDILANPTLLANAMMDNYDKLWTDERTALFVNTLADNNIALEINARYRVPNARIINAAKAAGVKFALGTNNSGLQSLDRLEYPLRMVKECGLTINDMWFPRGQ